MSIDKANAYTRGGRTVTKNKTKQNIKKHSSQTNTMQPKPATKKCRDFFFRFGKFTYVEGPADKHLDGLIASDGTHALLRLPPWPPPVDRIPPTPHMPWLAGIEEGALTWK